MDLGSLSEKRPLASIEVSVDSKLQTIMVKVEGESNGTAAISQLECGPVSTLSESSFIVIGHGSMTSGESFNSVIRDEQSQNPSTQTRQSEQEDSNKPTLSLLSSSYVEPKDIQHKLDIVLQENLELKETLHQNNLAMRQQMETLSVWQNEVAKVQQSHSEKFQQTRDLVVKLKAENNELRRHLEKFQQSREEVGPNPPSAEDFPSNAELEEERNKRLSEESKTKALLLTNTELTKLKRKADQQYELLVAENLTLRKHLEKYRFHDGNKMEELNKLVQQLTHKLETSERGRRQLEVNLEKARYGHTDKNLLQLSNENCGLRTTLTEKCKEIESLKKKLDEYTQKPQLDENEDEVTGKEVPIDTTSQDHFRERLLEAQSEIEFLRHQLDVTALQEEICSKKSKQIEELQRKIFSLETKLEAIPILEAQAEVYQADFHAEREARQRAVSEKENLERELKRSKMMLNANCYNTSDEENNLGESENNETHSSKNHGGYVCPVCRADFLHMVQLVRHVDDCLEGRRVSTDW